MGVKTTNSDFCSQDGRKYMEKNNRYMGKRFPLSFLEMLRGYFFENFSEREFKEIVEPLVGYKVEFCQDNESLSSYGVMREG